MKSALKQIANGFKIQCVQAPQSVMSRFVVAVFVPLVLVVVTLRSVAPLLSMSSAPIPGDTQDYDMLALSLSKGLGYATQWSDPEWRAPYEVALKETQSEALSDRYQMILSRPGGVQETAYRPPLYPAILAVIYQAFGRDFTLVYALQITALVLVTSLLVHQVWQLCGGACAAAVLIGALLDSGMHMYSAQLMTEVLAVSLLVVQLVLSLSLWHRGRRVVIGILVHGALCTSILLTRNILVVLLPLWVATVVVVLMRTQLAPRMRAAVFLGWVVLVLIGPSVWGYRNFRLTGHFLPFGTQGQLNILSGYSDAALQTAGVWRWQTVERASARTVDVMQGMSIRDEAMLGATFMTQALTWISDNRRELPKLFFDRFLSLWLRDASYYQIIIGLCACIGVCLSWNVPIVWYCVCATALVTLSVVLTYNDGQGRFLLVAHPFLWVCAAMTLSFRVRNKLSADSVTRF